MSRNTDIEAMALKIYDELNPNSDHQINVSKAHCIKLAAARLAVEEDSEPPLGPNKRVKLKRGMRLPGGSKYGGIIHHASRTSPNVWYVIWDGYKRPKCVPGRFLELE